MKTSFHSWVKNVLLITSPQLDPSITPTEPQWLTMVRFTHTASHSYELDLCVHVNVALAPYGRAELK